MNITEILEYSKSKEKIIFEDDSFLVVYKGQIDRESKEITDAEYERLFNEMLTYGRRRAMNLLVKKDYSQKELCDKLAADGYNTAQINRITEFLDGYHYLDDGRVAEQLVRSNRERKSIREMKDILKKHGISDEISEHVMKTFYKTDDSSNSDEDMSDSTSDEHIMHHETDIIKAFLKKGGYTAESLALLEYKERQKLAAKLYRKGFNSENIRKALDMSDYD